MCGKWIEEDSDDRIYDNGEIVQVREWVATIMVMMIPGINLVMLFWWALNDKSDIPASKVNWARGTLIVLGCLLLVLIFLGGCYLLMAKYFN